MVASLIALRRASIKPTPSFGRLRFASRSTSRRKHSRSMSGSAASNAPTMSLGSMPWPANISSSLNSASIPPKHPTWISVSDSWIFFICKNKLLEQCEPLWLPSELFR